MELNTGRVEMNISVLAGLDVLSPDEREGVLKAIESLENFSPDRPLDNNIQKFRPEQPFYLLHIDPSLRVIFEVNQKNKIEIQDLVRKETLEYMLRATKQQLNNEKVFNR